MNRRDTFKACAGFVSSILTGSEFAFASDFWSQPRHLWLRRQTGHNKIEEYKGIYFADGQIIWDEYRKVCNLLRDVKANKTVQMSPVLLDILCGIQGVAYSNGINPEPLITTSGHRTASTNNDTEGAVKSSLHIEGRAWDGRSPSLQTNQLASTARYLQGGGVGMYIDKGFCHVDDGRLRSWRG